jgi:sialidase-1
MTLSTSTDNGESWTVASIVDPGPAAYSALAFLPNGSLGLLYERMLALPNNQETYENITFTVAWEPKESGF